MNHLIRRTASAVLCVYLLVTAAAAKELVPVGKVVGLELQNDQVVVAGFDHASGNAAKSAGLCSGDIIQKINGEEITCAEDVRKALRVSNGAVSIEICRRGKISLVQVKPTATTEGPKMGLYLRQGVTGIGTVTWYDPETKKFGTLGHGVNDSSGNLLSMSTGSIFNAKVVSVKKGKIGEPGQLYGAVESREPTGCLKRNTNQGVFGTCENGWQGQPIEVAPAGEVRTGDAVIRSTVSGDAVREYSVKILKVYPKTRAGCRNLLVKITDPTLLAATGGIVQGMSGSPIIQDGKLVGAITHVLVNDPTMGYGIFIENMLDAAA